MLLRLFVLTALLSTAPALAQEAIVLNKAEDGVFADKIIFGQTAAFVGPTAELGMRLRDGILAAFKEANDAGGVNGRKLEMISRDDGYEPDSAIANTKAFILKDKVFALVGGVGSTTALAIEPITTAMKVPFIGPFTGSEFLRTPFKRYVVNVRPSYMEEAEEWAEHLTKDLNAKRIAIFYQDDSCGLTALTGLKLALKKRGMQLVGESSFPRNTVAVKEAAIETKESNPDVITLVGPYHPLAAFTKLVKQLGVKARFVYVSFVGSEPLVRELGSDSEGAIVTQAVPFPFDTSLPIVNSYQHALKKFDPKQGYSFTSLEGYIEARLTIEVLKNIQGEVTREAFINTLYKMGSISLDGMALNYGPTNNQGMDKVYLTVVENGHFISVTSLKR